MERPRYITPERFVELLAEVLANQSAEGLELSADDVAEVVSALSGRHLRRRTWSESWDVLCAVAIELRRPDLLAGGRAREMFATGVVMACAEDPEVAWTRVKEAAARGQRGLVRAVLELVEEGPPDAERTDEIRFRRLAAGVAAARSAGWPEGLRKALYEP